MTGGHPGLGTNAADGYVHDSEKAVATIRVSKPAEHDLLTATEAIEFLDVKRPTLYTYVSRGWLRSVPCTTGRGRRYVREDLERLKSRSNGHLGHTSTTIITASNGASLETNLTRIDANGPIYRGHSAIALARAGVRFESVAELLWTGVLPERCPDWSKYPVSDDHLRDLELAVEYAKRSVVHVRPDELQSFIALRLVLTALSIRRRVRMANARRNGVSDARELLLLSTALPGICGDATRAPSSTVRSIAGRLASAWKSPAARIEPARRARAMDQALVLVADHGLDKLAITVRTMAAAGADLYACISAGLDAFAGVEYDSTCMQLEHTVSDLVSPSAVCRYVAVNVDRGRSIPGFGHPWYPGGDPRATVLIEQAAALGTNTPRMRNAFALIEAARDQGAPTIEVGLVALAAALDLPFGSTATLVALGRMAGFIAHVFEKLGSARNGEWSSSE